MVPYRLLDGTTVANDWTSLAKGTLLHPIDVHEDATSSDTVVRVWTGTRPNGAYSGEACAEWSSDSNGSTADVGVTDLTTASWTYERQAYCDDDTNHLYCFEQ
jgi:hypothetical protein